METANQHHFLSLNDPSLRVHHLDQLVTMWSVFSKCKDHLKDGTRLENLSWRLWHQKQKHHFVQHNLSLSAGYARHEVSQKKQTQHDHVPGKEAWSLSFTSAPSTKTKASEAEASTSVAAPTSTTNTKVNTPSSKSASSELPNSVTNNSRTTTPSLSDSYQYEDDDDDDLYDDDYYDDDDDFDDDDDYLYDDDDNDDDDDDDDDHDDDLQLQQHRKNEKLRTYLAQHQKSQHYFEKTLPRPLTQRPSLLSALFKTPPNSSSSSTTSSSSSTTDNASTVLNNPRHTSNRASDHFLKKELTESLRNNVIWEHVQQKSLYTNQHHSYYHHPPPSHSYHPPLPVTCSSSNATTSHLRHPNRHNKKNIIPSDQGWLETFHGW